MLVEKWDANPFAVFNQAINQHELEVPGIFGFVKVLCLKKIIQLSNPTKIPSKRKFELFIWQISFLMGITHIQHSTLVLDAQVHFLKNVAPFKGLAMAYDSC